MFGWTRIATLAAVAAMLAMATGVAGATSKPGSATAARSQMPSAGKITTAAAHRAALLNAANLRTRAGAARYLRAIGVNPHQFVIQRGIRNYAGTKCPGARWSCTSTAHPVIQIASAGGSNTFQCATASCAVVQVSAPAAKPSPNTATCIKTGSASVTTGGQSCSINQTSATANNQAIVVQTSNKTSGLTQTASFTAQITQKATGSVNTNTACVLQNISLDGSTTAKKGTPVSVTLEAHQSISITQDSAHGGNTVGNAMATGPTTWGCDSTNPLTQSQTLSSTVTGTGSITQNENAAGSGPNLSLDIKQNQSPTFVGSASGANTAAFSQTNALTAIAITPAGPVNQTQSSSPNGGLLATVNQFSHDFSTIDASQTETQCEHAAQLPGSPTCNLTTPMTAPTAYSPTQSQYGPLRKGAGDSTQGDNPGDTFNITQKSTQNRDTGQSGGQQSNTVQGDCSTAGNCHVEQTTTVDGQPPTTNIQNGQNVDTSINCTGSTCTAPTPGIMFDGSPGTAAPPSTLGTYNMTAFGPDLQPLGDVSGVNGPTGTISFTPDLHHDQVPDGGWNNWSNGYTGDVYDTCFDNGSGCTAADPSHVRIMLPAGTNAFYFYSEANTYNTFTLQATAQDGTTSGPVSVTTPSGAKYFGFYGTGGATLSYIDVTANDSNGFAVGEFGINTSQIIG